MDVWLGEPWEHLDQGHGYRGKPILDWNDHYPTGKSTSAGWVLWNDQEDGSPALTEEYIGCHRDQVEEAIRIAREHLARARRQR